MDVLLPLIDTEKLASQQQSRQPALNLESMHPNYQICFPHKH